MSEMKFSTEHEWVLVDGDIATVGITNHATSELGDIVYLDLPEVGQHVEEGESAGEIESTKSVSDLFCPVGGDVTEINEAVVDDPAQVNADPQGDGWLIKIRFNGDLPDSLMDSAAYDAFIKDAQ